MVEYGGPQLVQDLEKGKKKKFYLIQKLKIICMKIRSHKKILKVRDLHCVCVCVFTYRYKAIKV